MCRKQRRNISKKLRKYRQQSSYFNFHRYVGDLMSNMTMISRRLVRRKELFWKQRKYLHVYSMQILFSALQRQLFMNITHDAYLHGVLSSVPFRSNIAIDLSIITIRKLLLFCYRLFKIWNVVYLHSADAVEKKNSGVVYEV